MWHWRPTVRIRHSTPLDSLAQLAEHLTFNQGVRSSNLRWVTTAAQGNLGGSFFKYSLPTEQNRIMGCRQAVRQRTLTPSSVGSNPASPAIKDMQKRYIPEKPRFYRGFSRLKGVDFFVTKYGCKTTVFPFWQELNFRNTTE